MVATADETASRVFGALTEHLDAGRDVVVVEPSDLAMFRREYEKFLPAASHERLADASYEVVEYVFDLLENGGDADALAGPDDDDPGVAYHSHCQQRTLGAAAHTEAVLDRLGYDVVVSETECCGMAGSFGYKRDYYELSLAVGENLADEFGGAAAGRRVVASGTSCLDQLNDLLERKPAHPVELLNPARR